MGLVPYIKTGSAHSADGMNDLYGALDGILNTMTNNKSLYFMNGQTTKLGEVADPSAPPYMVPPGDDFIFGVHAQHRHERTSSPKRYWFLDGCKGLDSTGQCVKHWNGATLAEDGSNPITVAYESEEDCINKHCGNYQDCPAESLVPAGEWGWWYKLIGSNWVAGGSIEEALMPPEGLGQLHVSLDYEKNIDPLMKGWEKEFLPIDFSIEQNLVLGIEHSILNDDFACGKCKDGEWMKFIAEVCAPGTGPGEDCEVIAQYRKYRSYFDCHFWECKELPDMQRVLHPSGSVWEVNFTQQIGCSVPWSIPCPCSTPTIPGSPYCANLQHSLSVPKMGAEFTVYEITQKPVDSTMGAGGDEDPGGGGGSEDDCYSCDGEDSFGGPRWQNDWNGPCEGCENNFQTLQGCYEWYCNAVPSDQACCNKASAGESSGEGESEEAAPKIEVNKIIYEAKDARQITFDLLSYWKDTFNRPIDLEIKGQDEFRFEHYGWCWEDDPDLDKDFVKGTPRSAHSAYNNPNCEREQKYAGKPPPETPRSPTDFGFRWPCSFSEIPIKGIPNHFPNLEQRFTPAELIFDGRKDKYQKFKFSNEYNRYKFFRIHNLNNYDMEFEFEPDDGLDENSKLLSKGIWESAGGEKIVVGECSAGAGTKFTIPRHESRCVRRDWGDYTTGYNNFQKFLAGDALYQLELTEAENAIAGVYPQYYDFYDMTHSYIVGAKSNNIVNPFIIDDYINKFKKWFSIDPAGPRTWDSSGLYMSAGQQTSDAGEVVKYGGKAKEYAGTRSYDEVWAWSMSGFYDGNYGRSPYKLMTQPSHRNFYQDPFYDKDGARVHAKPLVALDNQDSILADFLYHTGWALQVANIKSGSSYKNCPSCVEKRLIPYSGARHVHDFINNMNVNVLPIEPVYMHVVNRGDFGLSGFSAAPMQMFNASVHFNKEDDLGGASAAEATANKLALEGGTSSNLSFMGDKWACAQGQDCVGLKNWFGMPSYTSADALAAGADPIDHKGYSGIGPIKSTLFDYDGERMGPKHLRYVRHHDLSPNSGDWVKTVGKHVGFWGPLKERTKWTEDPLDERQTLACSGLQEDIRREHSEKVIRSNVELSDQRGYSVKIECGDGKTIGFEDAADCAKMVEQGVVTLPTVYVLADDEDEAKEEAVKECTVWNKKRGIYETDDDGVKTVKSCSEDNIGALQKNPDVPMAARYSHWGKFEEGDDNNDPYAYSIHQLALSTNVLGQNSWNHLKGQLYPIAQIGEERHASAQCYGPAHQILNSHIDFMNTHDIKVGSYFYANIPKPFGTTNLALATQGYELTEHGQSTHTTEGHPSCYPLHAVIGKEEPWQGGFVFGGIGASNSKRCWGRTFTEVAHFDGGNYYGDNSLEGPFRGCPSWTNMGVAQTLVDSADEINIAIPMGDEPGGPGADAWKSYNGVVNHKLEDQCTKTDWESKGKVSLISIAQKFVDEEWRDKIGEDQEYFEKDFSDGTLYNLGAAHPGYVTADYEDLFVDKKATFDYAITVDEGAVGGQKNLNAPHNYKYSFWHAIPRNHFIYSHNLWDKYFKAGFDCELTDPFDKDWLSCGLPAGWRSNPNYRGEVQGSLAPRRLWPLIIEYNPHAHSIQGGGWEGKHPYTYGVIPYSKSHIIPIKGGSVPDVPIMQWREERTMPLIFKHDYSKVGEDYSYYGYITKRDEDGEITSSEKAKSSFEARRDMFGITLRDVHEAFKEFNKWDGMGETTLGGYWTGYTGQAPCPVDDAGVPQCHEAARSNWDGSELEGDGRLDYWKYLPIITPMPQVKLYANEYDECCTSHCEYMDLDDSNEWGEIAWPGGSPYATIKACREGEKAAGVCGTGYLLTDEQVTPQAKALIIQNSKDACRTYGEVAAGTKYDRITAMSPPGGFETKDAFNHERGEEAVEGSKRSESSYEEEFFDNSAALNHWQFNYEAAGKADANTMFYDELYKMFAEEGGDPFDGNYVKPIYGEYGKFSYSWQKNINLRYKFKENFQSWGSDDMGVLSPHAGAYDSMYQISKAGGVGYDGAGAAKVEASSPILYARYYRPIISNRTTFGGIVGKRMPLPPHKPSVIQLTNTWLHKDVGQSMSWFWNTNRTKESWSNLEPHGDSEFLIGTLLAGPSLGPPGGALYRPTGIIWNHPDLYLKEVRKEHIISAFKGDISLEEKNIIGFHREYSPIDEKFRFGRQITSCLNTMKPQYRFMPYTDIEGPTSITWDQHLDKYGPPRKAYEITGVNVPMDDGGNPVLKGYWPACVAVYYAQGYIIQDDTDRAGASRFKCAMAFFGDSTHQGHDTAAGAAGVGVNSAAFRNHWLKYKDYCPTLKFSRGDGSSPHSYDHPMFERFVEPCAVCGGEKWKKHKADNGDQKYNAEWECRARMDKVCADCDGEKWKTFDDAVRLIWPIKSNGPKILDLNFVDAGSLAGKDKNTWFENPDYTYPGHGGMDIGFIGLNPDGSLGEKGNMTVMSNGKTSHYNYFHPNVDVVAAADGKVIAFLDGITDMGDGVGCSEGNCGGNFVVIDHDPDGALGLIDKAGYRYTEYSHMQKNSITVVVGETVSSGQVIGKVGGSGWTAADDANAEPHLHFEVGTEAPPLVALDPPCISCLNVPVDPFNLDPGKSMWKDQCSLPIYDSANYGILSAQTEPKPPKCETPEGGVQRFVSELTCRIAACAEDEDCCPRCSPFTVSKDHVDAYREMDIVPSGFPNINCKGEIDDVRLFEVVEDTMHQDEDGDYTTYDECQACTYTWDHGPYDGGKGRYGSGGTIKGIENLKESESNAPALRSDRMYRPAGIPHFYDFPPTMTIEPPKLWPPPHLDAHWENMANAIGCEENVIRPDKIIETIPSPPSVAGVEALLMEHWTGVAWTSGTCEAGGSPMTDEYLDAGHAEIQDYWMAERICADHTAPCAGFDHNTVRDPMTDGQNRYFPGWTSTLHWGRHMGIACEPRVTWHNTNNIDYSALKSASGCAGY